MTMDVLVVAVFVSTIFFTMHRGLVLTIVNLTKCVLAGFLAFRYCDDLKNYILEKTEIGAYLTEKIREAINNSFATVWENTQTYSIIPDLFKFDQEGFIPTVNDISAKATDIILGITAFLIIILAVIILSSIIVHLFSKDYNGGFTGCLDRFLGLLLGILMGAFYVFVFLALVIPITGIFAPDLSQELLLSLEESYFAADLYHNNILLVIFRDFVG